MGQTLYLECNAGISGDMAVAALLDLGADREVLLRTLESLSLHGYKIEIGRVELAGLDICDFNVKLEEAYENHDHDMAYLHGHEHQEHLQQHQQNKHQENEHHSNEQHQEHCHEHQEEDHQQQQKHHHHHHHEHRGLQEIQEIIENSNMTERAKATALRIFSILAQAEAKAHGTTVSQVHFHEVGAVDSIVDIAGFAICLDNLDITEVIVPYLCEGRGTIQCQHGILPIPVPAVANIIQMHKINVQLTNVYGELVTPTGAAITAAIKTKEELPELFSIKAIGMGAGKRKYERPSILRAMLIKTDENRQEEIVKLETDIDDCTGEMLGYVMEQLFQHGARDVHYTPVFMKKNRPAYQLTVLCKKELVEALEEIIFKETTTIGIRRIKMQRTVLARELETVRLSAGDIQVKKCFLPDGTVRRYPEYETIAELARSTELAMQDILEEWKSRISNGG